MSAPFLDIAMRQLTLAARRVCFFLGSDGFHRALTSLGRNSAPTAVMLGKARNSERMWRQFFTDPQQWWDHRSEKKDAGFPDFTHKKTHNALWLDGKSNPRWVKEKLATMPAGSIQRSLYSWNAVLSRSVKDGRHDETLELYGQMQQEGMSPDTFTYVSVLKACATVGTLKVGSRVHAHIIESGCESDVFVASSLIQMYAKCGCIKDARGVFNKMHTRDLVVWTTMINGYVRCGQGQEALEVYQNMQLEGVEPDSTTFLGVLSACANVRALEVGRAVHEQLIQRGYDSDPFVGSCLVDMYSECGSIEDAWGVFTKMPVLDLVSWNAMILGYVKCGEAQEALHLFHEMQLKGVKPNPFTFVGVLNACACVGALEEGRHVHLQLNQNGCTSNLFVASSLVDMYTKCGSVEDARVVFNKIAARDIVLWNTMLGAYATHGHAKEAFELFEQMCQAGIQLNSVTLVCLLSACSHAGLVDEGLYYLESMTLSYGISATVDHFSCMVDLLGRAGRLNEAEDVINMMSCKPNVTVWKALLGACRLHGNAEVGERVAKRVIDLDPENSSGYVLLSNIYAAIGNWDSSSNTHQMRKDRVVKK